VEGVDVAPTAPLSLSLSFSLLGKNFRNVAAFFFYNILIYSKGLDEHIDHLRHVHDVFRKKS